MFHARDSDVGDQQNFCCGTLLPNLSMANPHPTEDRTRVPFDTTTAETTRPEADVKETNGQSRTCTPAADRVIAIPELLEHILTNFSRTGLSNLRRVSPTFRNVIDGSTILKKVPFAFREEVVATRVGKSLTLLQTPTKMAKRLSKVVTVNALLFEEITDLRKLRRPSLRRIYVPKFALTPTDQTELSIRRGKMYITQPPIDMVIVTYRCVLPDWPMEGTMKVKRSDGVRYGDVIDAFRCGSVNTLQSWEIAIA